MKRDRVSFGLRQKIILTFLFHQLQDRVLVLARVADVLVHPDDEDFGVNPLCGYAPVPGPPDGEDMVDTDVQSVLRSPRR